MQRLTPEFAFVAACCVWPREAGRYETIRQAAAQVRDWNLCRGLIRFHRVGGLVWEGIRGAGIDVPEDIAADLARQASVAARQSLQQAAECVRLQQRFDAAGIPSLILKGVALAQQAYGTLGLKTSRDIDILVPPACARAALVLAERCGYVLSTPYFGADETQRRFLVRHVREFALSRRDGGGCLEIGWCLSDNSRQLAGVPADFSGRSVALNDAYSVRTLTDADLFCYLCLHGARHRWFRLKWLADLHAFVRRLSPGTLADYCRRAAETGCGICAAQGLLLCREFFAMPLPDDLLREMSRHRRLRYLMAAARKAMGAGDASCRVPALSALSPYGFLMGGGLSFVWTQLRMAAVQPLDVVRFPLPEKLYFLYWVFRVPFYVLRRAGTRRP